MSTRKNVQVGVASKLGQKVSVILWSSPRSHQENEMGWTLAEAMESFWFLEHLVRP